MRDVPRLPARSQVRAGEDRLEALRASGHEPRLVVTGGGSDANALVAAGYAAVLLANGTEANHTPDERVTEAAIAEMLSVCEARSSSLEMLKLRRGVVSVVDPLVVGDGLAAGALVEAVR